MEFGSEILDLGPLNKYKKNAGNKILDFLAIFGENEQK